MESLPEINLNTAKGTAKQAAASLKSAGSLVAKKAERTKLVTVTLPRAYAELGKAIYKEASRRDEFADLFKAADDLLAQRKRIQEESKARPTATSLAEKAKNAASDAAAMARTKAIDLQAYQSFAKLGEAVYQHHGAESGPSELVEPIAKAIARRDQLDQETAGIDAASKGRWLTPKRVIWGVGILMVIGLIGSILDPKNGGGEDEPPVTPQKSSLSGKARKVIDSSKGLQIIESLGELDPEEVERYAEMVVSFNEKGQTFVGTTSENMLLLLMVPSAKWKTVAKKKGLSRQQYFFATNMIFIGMGNGYDPQDRSMHDAQLLKVTGERLSDY